MGKRGPKARGGYGDKTAVFSSRLTAETKGALQEAAAKSGRSLSSEVEHRLRKSFDNDKVVDVLGGWQMYAILRIIAAAMDASGFQAVIAMTETKDPNLRGTDTVDLTATNWLNDAYAFDCAVRAANTVLEAFRPGGDPNPPILSPDFIARLKDRLAAESPPPPEDVSPEIYRVARLAAATYLLHNRGELTAKFLLEAIAGANPTQPPPAGSRDADEIIVRRIASDLGVLHGRLLQPDRLQDTNK